MKKPEILSPAGNFEKLRFAELYGADAVYFAGERFGMRAMADNFSKDEICRACDYLHARQKKAYITINTMPRSSEISLLEEFLETVEEAHTDAVIVADLGVFNIVRKRLKNTDIHISTQAAGMNWAACRMWHELGAKRIVLARELSLDDVADIRAKTPADLELEAFVHGAMCVSVSGRCMLSEYYTGRDANRGVCAQPCRWIYKFAEEKRPDDVLTAMVYPEGTYIFGSKDMNMIEYVGKLAETGIDSFKIEGRMKSAYYTATVTNSYRIALDAWYNGTLNDELLSALKAELDSVSHREYCTGYWFTSPETESNIASDPGYQREKAFLATVESYNPSTHRALCRQRNKMCQNDSVELVSPGKLSSSLKINAIYDGSGKKIESTPHANMLFEIDTDIQLSQGDIIRGK